MAEYKMLIGGNLVDGDSSMEIVNPSTEQVLALCPRASARQLDQAVAAAKTAFAAWSRTSVDERRGLLIELADALHDRAEDMARLLTLEQGKPLSESIAEVAYTEIFIRQFATLDVESRLLEDSDTRRVELQRRPLGVVAAIVAWNFPVLLIAFKLPLALLAGNTVVVKPAASTPLTALLFGELCAKIFPPGVVNVITDGNDLGGQLTSHPDVAKISFTGSTTTGRKIMASAAASIKRLTLELGGNDAAILLSDIDPVKVAPEIFNAAFMNCGQACIAVKRVYAHDDIYDSLCDELARLADEAIVDDGLAQGAQIGPLQNRNQYDKIKALIEESGRDGKIIAGGTVVDRPGYFIRPTIVRDIKDGSRLVDEEQFGPILPVIRFRDEEVALEAANGLDFGLGGSIWSADVDKALDLAGRMDSGMVWINKHLDFGPTIPFGGAKQSGFGIEFAEEGLKEYSQIHIVNRAK